MLKTLYGLVMLACLLNVPGLARAAGDDIYEDAGHLVNLPAPVKQRVTEDDLAKLTNFAMTRDRAIRAALASNQTEDVAALKQILAGSPRETMGSKEALLGIWRCRSAQLGAKADGTGSVYVYPFFRCSITRKGGNLFFAKLTGSQLMSGMLYPSGNDYMVLVGGDAAAIGTTDPIAYGTDGKANAVGFLFRIDDKRMRLERPNTCCSTLEILELVR